MTSEHFDVVIVGAGLSGIGAAAHLLRECPEKSWVILEARDRSGGTWDLFRYPGIRSDSDMFTLGYSFKPWVDPKAIADGPSILSYIRETAHDHGIDQRIRFRHRLIGADWSGGQSRWKLRVQIDGQAPAASNGRAPQASPPEITCGYLFMCSGYYRYDEGYTPPLPELDRFTGRVVHPQHWPEGLEVRGKRVVVIGSGATAVTLVPALSAQGADVTMLQRSPSYVISRPAGDALADRLRRRLPSHLAYRLVRRKNVALTSFFYRVSRRRPELVKRFLRKGVRNQLPEGFDLTHFTPTYNPWDQRICLVPDGDLFRALRSGEASIVTGRIARFTEHGIALESGQELAADIVVTATGLNLQLLGGAELSVDGERVELSQKIIYKGMMLSGVPNLALAVGYTNASWTLKCDLIAEYVCRLLNFMDRQGYRQVTPLPPPSGQPLVPSFDLSSGYVLRSLDRLPKQGTEPPWKLHQNYAKDIKLFRRAPLDDVGVVFSTGGHDDGSESEAEHPAMSAP